MNAIGILFQQTNMPFSNSRSLVKGDNKQTSLFDTTLQEEQLLSHRLFGDSQLNVQKEEKTNEMHFNGLAQFFQQDIKGMDQQPINTLLDYLIYKQGQLEELTGKAELLLTAINEQKDIEQVSPKLLQLLEEWSVITDSHSSFSEEIDSTLMENLTDLIEKIQVKLGGKDTPLVNVEEDAKQLLELLTSNHLFNEMGQTPLIQNLRMQLEQVIHNPNLNDKNIAQLQVLLTQLKQIIQKDDNLRLINLEAAEGKENSKERAIWHELLQTYQKRKSIESIYRMNANVRNSDISKWLTHALNRLTANETVVNQSGFNLTTMPMSKIEQYVIHVNQTQEAPLVDKQIINQFEKIMQTSKFLTQPNGRMQLSVMLRPENLGEMMIRLTQNDGEMVIKITVNSGATKDVLERNLHQLRNIFSPHQVVIERQEISLQQASELTKEQTEESLQEHENEEQQDQHDDQEQDDNNESTFQEILMNEKV